MARRAAARRTSSTRIVPYVARASAPAPVIIRERVAAPAKHHKKGKRRSSGGGSGGVKRPVAVAIAGFLLGVVDKQGTAFPTIPVLGRAGTAAVALHFASKQFKSPMLADASIAAAAIAGYELGKDGTISGIEGVAAQV